MAKILYVEPTPNPNAAKIVLDQNVTMGVTKNFTKVDEAFDNPLARQFFDIHGVESVFFLDNFITLNKTPAGIWDFIFFKAQEILMAARNIVPIRADGVAPSQAVSTEAFEKMTDSEKLTVVNKILDEQIRPNLARDGGGLQVLALQGDVLTVKYQGACGSCPSSTAQTLNYISNLLQQKVNPDLQVVPA